MSWYLKTFRRDTDQLVNERYTDLGFANDNEVQARRVVAEMNKIQTMYRYELHDDDVRTQSTFGFLTEKTNKTRNPILIVNFPSILHKTNEI